ncbi:MAG TPA: phage virion morphogenesis protein [Coleofasciculaceae cyanobacterium]
MSDPILSAQVLDTGIRDRLNQLQRKTGNLEIPMRNIGQALLLSTDTRWQQEIDPQGKSWKPNSPYTIAQKRAQGRINKILQNTGRLRDSITAQASRDRVVIGTNVAYADKNQKERQFLGLSKDDEQEIIAILDEFLAEE